jgi:hypothetical protein
MPKFNEAYKANFLGERHSLWSLKSWIRHLLGQCVYILSSHPSCHLSFLSIFPTLSPHLLLHQLSLDEVLESSPGWDLSTHCVDSSVPLLDVWSRLRVTQNLSHGQALQLPSLLGGEMAEICHWRGSMLALKESFFIPLIYKLSWTLCKNKMDSHPELGLDVKTDQCHSCTERAWTVSSLT